MAKICFDVDEFIVYLASLNQYSIVENKSTQYSLKLNTFIIKHNENEIFKIYGVVLEDKDVSNKIDDFDKQKLVLKLDLVVIELNKIKAKLNN